jgi:hypothetical protein
MKSINEIGNSVLLTKEASLEEIEFYKRFGYRGCGRAWAALNNGQIVAIVYMSGEGRSNHAEFTPPNQIPRPVYEAIRENSVKYFNLNSPSRKHELCQIAIRADLISGTKGNNLPVTGSTLCARLRVKIREEEEAKEKWDAEYFAAWRTYARSKLAEFGEIISGMCSCHEFIAKSGEIYSV